MELGGKSPALVHRNADLKSIAPRLVTGKLFNAGQTCIAPDYVLAPQDRIDELVAALQESVAALYPTLGANPDYTSIVSDRQYARLAALVADAEAKGARAVRCNPANELLPEGGRKLQPTLLVGVRDDMAAMREEIFGPVLPIESYASIEEAIARINARPRPLALYAFGGDARWRERILRETFSGGVTLDDTLWHFSNDELPFGGIGASGMGAYHGERGFRTFSHEKPVFIQSRFGLAWLLRPPYGERFELVLRILRRIA